MSLPSNDIPPQPDEEHMMSADSSSASEPSYYSVSFWQRLRVPLFVLIALLCSVIACELVAYLFIPFPYACPILPYQEGSACNYVGQGAESVLVYCGNGTPIRDGLTCDIPIPYQAQFVNRQGDNHTSDTLATWNYISHRANLIQYTEAYQAILPKTGWRCITSRLREDTPDSPYTGIVTAFSPAAGGKPGGRNLRIDFWEGTYITLAITMDTSPLASCGRAIG